MPIRNKKAQMITEVFKYVLAGLLSIIIVTFGYISIAKLKDRSCNTEFTKFEIDLKGLDKEVRFGEKRLRSFMTPCKVDKVYFFDRSKGVNPKNFEESSILMDSIKSGSTSNVYLVQDDDVKRSFSAGNVMISYPYFICIQPKLDKISFSIEGTGAGARVSSACEQPDCAFVLNSVSENEARKILTLAVQTGCNDCPSNINVAIEKFKQTSAKVASFRRFSHCSDSQDVDLLLKAENSNLGHAIYLEYFPQECIQNLEEYVSFGTPSLYIEGQFIVIDFGNIDKEKKVSYRINKELDDACKAAIKGIALVG